MPRSVREKTICRALMIAVIVFMAGCSTVYYSAMEKAGIHKRDILVDRVEAARDAQTNAQARFKSALEQFSDVVHIGGSDLKTAYERLNSEYQAADAAAKRVTERIDKVESVAGALFAEWEKELALYSSDKLRQASKSRLEDTRKRYATMLSSMRKAEQSMTPVLETFSDDVLFLKHNLNAQAIGALKIEFSTLKKEIDNLIREMNASIATSEQFIAQMKE